MGDLVKAFKANPGGISWGGGSAGGTDHILVGLIAKATGVDPAKINYVPFKGGGEAIAAIVGGHVTAGVSGIGEFAEQIKGGRMRALAVSSPSKIEGYPTLKEQALDVELPIGAAPSARQGSHSQRDALIKIIRGATESAAWKTTLEKLGWSPIFLSGDDYKKFVDEDTKRIAGIIDSLGIKGKNRKQHESQTRGSHSVLGGSRLGIGVAVGASQLSSAGGYARMGPNAAPAVIAGGLILLGLWLAYEALSGGWRNAISDDPAERGEHRFHAGAFIWVSRVCSHRFFSSTPPVSCSPRLCCSPVWPADSAARKCRAISPSALSWAWAYFFFS